MAPFMEGVLWPDLVTWRPPVDMGSGSDLPAHAARHFPPGEGAI